MAASIPKFDNFAVFYPFYLSEHSNRFCRRMHFIGSTLVLLTLLFSIVSAQPAYLWLLPVFGYGCAWIGHFVFEKNRPATFKVPLYSLIGDWVMYRDMWLGRVTF